MTAFRELSQHILDIVENGVSAGAKLIILTIQESIETDTLQITIKDDGKGMDKEMLQAVTDPWVTTRTTRKVGLGIPFFKQAAEMCGGSFDIQSEVGKGTQVVAIFQRSHIDRPPLGDLEGTLLCLIVGYPTIDLVYQHKVGENDYVLDTREIRQVLGDDVPLSDPEILAFLRSTLEEGEQSLGD
ncbi:MAG: sensor histidine kinase [Anaerolineae bacterium]|nr:sensor histidine kinase [Anaerolineae bacterium]